jgi:hypothetical protein
MLVGRASPRAPCLEEFPMHDAGPRPTIPRPRCPRRRRLRATLAGLATTILALAGVVLAQTGSPWTLLQDPDGFTYVSTADPTTGLPRAGENGELFFACSDEGDLFAGVIVDAGPPDPTAVEAFLLNGERVEATGGADGYYLLDVTPDAGLFPITATVAAYVIGDAESPAAAVALQALAGGRAYPIVTAAGGTGYRNVMTSLPCVEATFFGAPSADAATSDPFADAPPPADPFADPPAAEDPFADAPQDDGTAALDEASLAAALTAGGDVRLPAGTFTLGSDVVPNGDLRLIGAGVDATTLRMPAIDVSGISAEATNLTIQGLTIVVDGPGRGTAGPFGEAIASFGGELILRDLAIVNRAEHGDVDVSGVTLVSGTLSGDGLRIEGFPLAGIYLEGGVANLRDVTLARNRNGIQAQGFDEQPYAELRDVTLSDNELAGIAVFDDASALVSGGRIAGNGSEATYVGGTGSLTLENLTVENHASYGVFADGGRAVLRNVTLRGNQNAVWALLDSTVTLERSEVLESRGFAVAGNGTGTTTLRRVTVDGSELSAVHAEEARSLIVEASTIRGAGESGVNLLGDARAEVRDSRVEGATINGVEARGAATVVVVNTTVAGNGNYGILVDEQARHDLQGVTYEANVAGAFRLPDAGAAATAPVPEAPARPARPSRSGAGSSQPAPPPTPAQPAAPAASASGTWEIDASSELFSYQDGARSLGFVCGVSDDGSPVIFLSLPDLSIPSDANGIAVFRFARSDGSLGSADWNFLDVGDGLFVTDEIATDDIGLKLLPNDGSDVWNTVVVSLPGAAGSPLLVVPGAPRVAELLGRLTCF